MSRRTLMALLAAALALTVALPPAAAAHGRALAAVRPLPPDTAQSAGYMPIGDTGAALFYMLQEKDGGAK
jgi:hypothetical protein